MKAKFPQLPRYIIKQQNGRYRNMKTLKWLSTSQLAKECQQTPVNTELKQNKEVKPHWSNNYYGN